MELERLIVWLVGCNILVITAVYGAYLKPSERTIPRPPSQINGEGTSLRRLIQYYRSEAGQNPGVGISAEVDSDESRASSNQHKPHLYRIDLSGGDDYDGTPYADEMLPVASYIHDASKSKPSTLATTTTTTLPTTSMTTSETTTVKSMVEPEIKNMSSPGLHSTDAQPQINVTTMTPVLPIENTTSSSMAEMQIKATKHEDDDAMAPPKMENEDEEELDDEEDSEERCEEGQTKKQKCNNTCVCVDGAFFCSKKKCPSKPGMVDEHHHEQMMEKVGYTINKKGWSVRKKLPALTDCSSGMTKSIDCNQCICAQGKWACTKRSCIALTFREKASYTDGSIVKQVEGLKENHDLDEDCAEGNTRELGCNQCVCHYNSWSCTNFPCAVTTPPPRPEDIEEACQREADVKSKDCNLCKCTRGIWVCTRNNCKTIGDRHAGPPTYRSSSKITKA